MASSSKYIFPSQRWAGNGRHNSYGEYYRPDLVSEAQYTRIVETRNASAETSSFGLINNICYPNTLYVLSSPVLFQNQSYVVKIGDVINTGTIPDSSNSDWVTNTRVKVPLPDLAYSVQHSEDILVPYSLEYNATVQVDQTEDSTLTPSADYSTFQVIVFYSGNFLSRGFYNLYGSVEGVSKKIKKLYGPVNGQSKKIVKLYGSINGQSKLIYKG